MRGAAGGEATFDLRFAYGRGAQLSMPVQLSKGDMLKIIVGAQGGTAQFYSGGGGASAVWLTDAAGLLAVAGGGGAAGRFIPNTDIFTGGDANPTNGVGSEGSSGRDGYLAFLDDGRGGTNGNGGTAYRDFQGTGGGGILSAGGGGQYGTGGGQLSFASDSTANGGVVIQPAFNNGACVGSSVGAEGGYGGGGTGYGCKQGSGGGGGWSGGGGGPFAAGGGGCFCKYDCTFRPFDDSFIERDGFVSLVSVP